MSGIDLAVKKTVIHAMAGEVVPAFHQAHKAIAAVLSMLE